MHSRLIVMARFFSQKRWAIWLFYGVLTLVYFLVLGQKFIANWQPPTWMIAPIMAFGSFVAGSTFLGGGSVAFPALTKIYSFEPVIAKSFSLAIQSVGMTSASLYIFTRVRGWPMGFMALYLLGATLGLLFSIGYLEAQIPPLDIRISFTLFLLCFLAVYLLTSNIHNISSDTHLENNARDVSLTMFCGIFGGMVSGLLGSGADLVGFTLLVFYFRIEIRRAIQTSVVLMAATSILGIVIQYLIRGIDPQVVDLWYVAAPVVLFGAPLGAVLCRYLSKRFLVLFICLIVAAEVVSTIMLVPIDRSRLVYYLLAAMTFIGLLAAFRILALQKHGSTDT